MNLNADNLESMRLPDLWARYAQVVGVESRTPNRKFLIRKIREATVGAPPEVEPDLEDDGGPAPSPEPAAREDAAAMPAQAVAPDPVAHDAVDRGADLRRLPIAELQARYLEVVGRASDSSSPGYLSWKIREVQKGHIAAGPRRPRAAAEETADMKVLPLRLPGATVDALDAAVERLGFASRMAFLRAALAGYLEARGEITAARLLAGGGDEA